MTVGEGAVGEGSMLPHVVVATAAVPRTTARTQVRIVVDVIAMNSPSKAKSLHTQPDA